MNRRRLDALERLFGTQSAEREMTTILTEEERIAALTRLYAAIFARDKAFTAGSSPDEIWQWAHEHAIRKMAIARASGIT